MSRLRSAVARSGSRATRLRMGRADCRRSEYSPNATRRPCAIWASALPVSESLVSENRTKATAIIGTTTMITKNRKRRARKLMLVLAYPKREGTRASGRGVADECPGIWRYDWASTARGRSYGAIAQFGRAPGSHPGGRRFEPG